MSQVVWVAGGRDYINIERINQILDRYHAKYGIERLIHGAALGADTIAERWAKSREVPYTGIPAQWGQYGKAAGPIRNEVIARIGVVDALIAFPGGPGTADAIEKARTHGIIVYEIDRGEK